jgi:hypothetical protein
VKNANRIAWNNVSVAIMNRIVSLALLACRAAVAVFCLPGALLTNQAQSIRSMDYVVNTGGVIWVVVNNRSELLEKNLILTDDLKVMTNGVIQIKGEGEVEFAEGRKVSLDGFWINDDGLLVRFKPHFMLKDNTLFFVEQGLFTRVRSDVAFKSGDVLRTDGTVMTRDQRIIRLQDGQALMPDGKALPALDHIMIINGKLVLQKDGSIIPLPLVSTMGMSEGTKVKGDGIITSQSGEQFNLNEGQRLIVAGAAMVCAIE